MSTVEHAPKQITDNLDILYEHYPNRGATLEIRNFLSSHAITQGAEATISSLAIALAQLRGSKKGIYNEYCREDIVKGISEIRLGKIDHPVAQLVIAKSFIEERSPDGSPIVAQAAEKILLDPARYIHPETLEELLAHSDPKVKELGLKIVEHNPQAGIMPDGTVVPSVMKVLQDTFTPGTEDKEPEGLRKLAILTSLLQERTNGRIPEDLVIYAEDILANYIIKRIDRLRESNIFAMFVSNITAVNETAAKTAANIEDLTLTLPEELKVESEELGALMRLRPAGFGKTAPRQQVVMYRSLVALMKQRTRENLHIRVTQIKAQEARNREKLQAITEAANERKQFELQEAQERQAQIRREQLAVQAELVRKARVMFPDI